MANILSLALKINADASGLKLDPVQRALVNLGNEADKLNGAFSRFAGSSEAAARAQERTAAQSQALINGLRDGTISSTQFAAQFERLTEAVNAEAAAFERAARITEQNLTQFERFTRTQAELNEQVQAGRISQDTYNRAIEAAAAGLTEAERASAGLAARSRDAEIAAQAAADAEAARAAAAREAAAIVASVQTEEERREQRLARLQELLDAGALSEETYRRAVEQASGVQAEAARAEQERQRVLEEGRRVTEQFATVEEKRATELARLQRLLDEGAISEQTFARASAEASGANEAAAKAERERADALAAASRIIQANLTPQERYDQQIQELRGHLEAGRLSQEQFNRAAARAQGDLDKVGQEAGKADKNIESLASNVRILSTIEIGRLVVDGFQLLGSTLRTVQSQVTSLVTSVNASINQIDDFAQRTGIGVEALQGYSLAAKLAGVDTEQFGAAVQRLSVSIGKATPGDALDKSLRAINLSVQELRTLSPEQQFSVIGEAISQLPTVADRAAAAVEVFGKQGAALAPLFKEGAASIEELQQRAERLGIIVSEQQVNNVTAMNDAFDLVSATVQGIIGQVIGNLAPAVTAVTEEFLRFVEEFSGAQGEGGTGIANAITDVLLQGAEVLAGVFDSFVGNFTGFSESLEATGQVFNFVGNILKGISEALRVVFNTFERVGNLLIIGFGRLLEGLGSWVDSDLEQFGRDLQASGRAAFEQNGKELEQAAKNAAQAVSDAFAGGESSPQAAGAGAATQFIQGIRQRVEQERDPAFKIDTNIDELRERFDVFYGGIVDQSSAVTDAMREFEAVVAASQEDAALTADEIARIEAAQRTVNDLMDAELQKRAEAKEASAAQADQDLKRIEGLLQTTDAAAKIEQDILTIQREQARVAEQIAAARAAGQEEAATAAAARLAQLDQLQASLEDQQQALEQGFGQGFGQAFAQVDANISKLIDKSAQFGEAGFQAGVRLQEGIAEAQEQARDGILNAEAFNREVEQQQKLFEQELKNIDEANKARVKGAEDAAKKRAELEKAQQKAAEDAQKQLLEQQKRIAEEIQKEAARQQQEREAVLNEIAARRQQQFERDVQRIQELNTLGPRAIQGIDLRTQQGADLVLGLELNRQDPALIEQRIQTRLLQQIADGIIENVVRNINAPVAIVGMARLN